MTESPDSLQIDFKGRHDHISERMREHASKKLQKLARYNDRVLRIEVVAQRAHENPEVELIAHMRRGVPVVAKDRGESFAATIDLLVGKMEKQLKKQKEIRKDHKQKPARRPARGSRADKAGDEETYEEVVRKTLKG